MYRIWWNQITRANRIVNQITDAIQNNRSIVINTTGTIPWGTRLFGIIDDNIRETIGIRSLDCIGCPTNNVGRFLIEKYCKKEKRSSYRIGKSPAKFLAESEGVVLNKFVLWVKNVSSVKMAEWLSFIDEYLQSIPDGIEPALFILETSTESKLNSRKNVDIINLTDSISAYDRYAFCALLGTDLNMDPLIGEYLAKMVSIICAEDVELCAACMARGNEFMQDPEKCISSITDSSSHDDGTPFVFGLGSQQIANLIWETQIGMVFPALEKYRNAFVRKHYRDISKALPIKTEYEEITNPEEVELGTLHHLTLNGAIQMQNNMEASIVRRFKDARNDLAHLKPLDFETVKYILSEANKA